MFILAWLLSSQLFLVGGPGSSHADRAADSPPNAFALPNIVILYTDDQGYGDCSAYNSEARFTTPNLDRLAREGLRFSDGHSADTVCTPSRYALLTGRYSWRSSLKQGVFGADADCLLGSRTTLASFLRSAGYSTAVIGKWHLGMQIPGTKGSREWTRPAENGPLTSGFDLSFCLPASMNFGVLTYFENGVATEPASMWTRKKFPPAEIRTAPLQYRMMPPYDESPQKKSDVEVAPSFRDQDALGRLTAKAERFIRDRSTAAKASHPFFLYVPLPSPHLPHCTSPEFRGTSEMGEYGDFMTETDARIGQILAALDETGLAENTLVFFSSDNGPENNYRDWKQLYDHASAGIFRGGKRDVYEGGHRVPFIVRWPAVVKAATVCDEPVCQTDILATVADILGRKLADNEGEDSFSLLPLLRGTAMDGPARGPLIHHAGTGHFAIRKGRWKLILYRPGKSGEDANFEPGEPRRELYDLAADPAERTNVVALHPDIVVDLEAEATRIVKSGRSTPGAAQPNDGKRWWRQLTWIENPNEKQER